MDEQRRRDDVIERELNRAFQTSAATPAGERHLDAEAAAAWMDRRLDAGAARSIEAHLAACADCQALLATLARMSPAAEETGAGANGWSWWRRPWLVPFGAAAALAAVVWVVQTPPPTPAAESTQARAEAVEQLPEARPKQDLAAPAPSIKQLGQQTKAAPAQPGPGAPAPSEAASLRERRAIQGTAAAPQAFGAPPVATERADATAERANAVGAEPPVLDAQAAGKVAIGGATAAAPPAAPASDRQESASAVPRALNDAARRAAALRAADLTVVAADGTGRWRRAGGSIEFAAGAAAPFAAATLPLDAGVLIAGSSPAGAVCWLVGRGGAVLVTTDGSRFTRVGPPAAIDLVSVAATDARNATVTAADGRRYRTADAGGTWILLDR